MNSTDNLSMELEPAHFQAISDLLYRTSGIHLGAGKDSLVKSRLNKRLRALGFPDFGDYVSYLKQDRSGQEIRLMIESLTTHKTSFFRESSHFEFLRREVVPGWIASKNKIRIWCAGCSTGEEPYSLAMMLHEACPDIQRREVQILATDISGAVIERAKQGRYSSETVRDVPAPLLQKYFRAGSTGGTSNYEVIQPIRNLVSFARLNLMGSWPVKGSMHAIFCRNVMIYFDKPTQIKLADRFSSQLEDGGYLFIGHSESLVGASEKLRYVQPAAYQKC